jgi:hypothetical protein
VQFNEEEFYNPSLPNQKIRVYEETNLSQSINTLENKEATRILNNINVTHQEIQQDLGGEGTSESTTTTKVDHATLSQSSDSPHIQLTSNINELHNQQDNNNKILGDQPLTPLLNPKSDKSTDDSDRNTTNSDENNNTSEPFVLINNTNFDPSGYKPLSMPPKRLRSNSDTSRDQDEIKRPHINLTSFSQAFLLGQNKQPKVLISSIPPAPSGYHQLVSHPFESQFRQAMQIEFNKLLDMHAFEPINANLITHTHQTNCKDLDQSDCPRHQLIPMRWVFAYKSDELGYLTRCKARLCVRGDTQILNDQDARTSTLAARTFRTLIAIMTRYDLETFQMDAVNAFLNSTLKEEVYCRYPPGLGHHRSMILRLHKAVYGLRIAGKR